MQKRYYVDSSIYLNLWRKEESLDKNFWKIAKEFFDKCKETGAEICYLGYLLREIQFVLPIEEYLTRVELFEQKIPFRKINLSIEERSIIKIIMKNIKENVSFYDVIHAFLSRKVSAILVTRDKELLKFCRRYKIIADKPEKL